MKILLADDSTTMRKIIIRALGAGGFGGDVVEAACGNEVLEVLESGRFDLVVTDSYMPGMSGVDLVAAIRVKDENVPIIIVATEAEKGRVMQAMQVGASGYLTKPFTAQALHAKIGEFVS